MRTIAVVNLKGGSSKTSTTCHLGGTLAQRGQRVLWIDNDPQSSLTQGLLGPNVLHELDPERSIAAVYGSDPLPEMVIRPSGLDGLWLVPGHENATQWNYPLRGPDERSGAIRSILDDVRDDFDWCLIDNPPNLHLCTHAALTAADWVLTPMQCEDYGAQGMTAVNREVRKVQSARGGRPRILGYLLSMFDKRLGIHEAYSQSLREKYGDMVLRTVVPIAAAYKESVAARKPVTHYAPKSAAAKIFVSLADEIEQRVREASDGGQSTAA